MCRLEHLCVRDTPDKSIGVTGREVRVYTGLIAVRDGIYLTESCPIAAGALHSAITVPFPQPGK